MIAIPWNVFSYLVMGFLVFCVLLAACLFWTFSIGHTEGYKDGLKVGRASLEDHNDR
jgi:hypothetical protein